MSIVNTVFTYKKGKHTYRALGLRWHSKQKGISYGTFRKAMASMNALRLAPTGRVSRRLQQAASAATIREYLYSHQGA